MAKHVAITLHQCAECATLVPEPCTGPAEYALCERHQPKHLCHGGHPCHPSECRRNLRCTPTP